MDCQKLAALPPLPKGAKGYSKAVATEALARVRVSEIVKADCLRDLQDWTEGQLQVIRGE